jgi:hypothetical protein
LPEGRGDLHQAAERHGAKEIDWAHHQEGEDDGDLGIAGGEEGESLGALHDAVPIAHHVGEAVTQALLLGLFAGEQRDLLGVLPEANQREAEICLVALLIEIELHQRPADEMRHPGADDGIDQRRPNEIARNLEGLRANDERGGCGQVPQDHHERHQRDDRAEQSDADVERA